MSYIKFAIENPVKVAVGVMLILLFGVIAVVKIPIQLTPNVDEPIITVQTSWTGRSPEEVEREIIEEQEDKLKGVRNLRKMTATAEQGNANIELEFYIGTDMTRALQEVSDKLREVPEYPDDVDEPVITAADSASENAIAWLILSSDDPNYDVQGFYDTADKRLKPILERVPGVGELNIYGGREREVHIQIDPTELAQRGITFNALANALRQENVNVSAGDVAEGRLDVRVRTIGQYDELDQIRKTIVAYDQEGGPVRISDLATVELTLEKQRSFVHERGRMGLAFRVARETGSNVMQVMAVLRERIQFINERVLPSIEPSLRLEQVYDETVYIDDAIALVRNNLLIGAGLAMVVLMVFLRTIRPTLVVALAIPISIIGTFVVMTAAGRNLNVISLAGLAFAVGMVVDAAIVVLENIDRHLGMGKRPRQAAFDGAREVWGAIFASTLTTIAVFVPVLTIQEEAGQLFRDISIAICAAVSLSLIVSVTVIPSASARFLRQRKEMHETSLKSRAKDLLGLASLLGRFNRKFADAIYSLTAPTVSGFTARLVIVGLFTLASIVGSWLLMPPTTYLPQGNRNLVFGMMFNPPGYNIEQSNSIADRVESVMRGYWTAEDYSDTAKLSPVDRVMPPFGTVEHIPPIENFFLVTFRGNMFMGAKSKFKDNVDPLGDLMTSTMFDIPGSFGFAQKLSLFGRGLGGTNSVDVEITASDLAQLRLVAAEMNTRLSALGQIQPDPMNFNLPGPELQIKIDRVRAQDLGIDNASLGLGVRALVDGAVIGDYRYEGDSIDLLLTRPKDMTLSSDTLRSIPVAAADPRGDSLGIVPLASLATFERTDAPQQIKRIEQRRAVALTVTPGGSVPLETAMGQITDIVDDMQKEGYLTGDIEVTLAGTADKLTQVREALLGSWYGPSLQSLMSLGGSRMFLALLVTFLLMAALFESFIYPFVIMFSVPLATIGGFVGLAIVHYYVPEQQLDVLTMLGFVILIGIVVNNAILIVHQALNFMRGIGESEQDVIEAMPPREAVRESVRTRIRPVLMTTTTSVFGMLPLVLSPGSGSELYRGLGSVVVGGLVFSTLFTLIVVPLLFSIVLDIKKWLYETMKWELPELQPVAGVAAQTSEASAPTAEQVS